LLATGFELEENWYVDCDVVIGGEGPRVVESIT
jgi:hypothetical protein